MANTLKENAKLFKWAFYGFIVVGVVLLAVGIGCLKHAQWIDKNYIPATARIEKIEKHHEHHYHSGRNRHHSIDYDVTVSYEVNGREYVEKLNAYSSWMKEGGEVSIKYNPENPSEISSSTIEYIIAIVLIVIGVIFPLTGGLVRFFAKRLSLA